MAASGSQATQHSAGGSLQQDALAFQLTQLAFWLMAATDGHAKNFSIFLGPGGVFRLTPLYDVLSMWPIMGNGASLVALPANVVVTPLVPIATVLGLAGGLLTVVAYVLVGLVYPQRLQAAIFAVKHGDGKHR